MKVAFEIIMDSDERETIEEFIHCLDDYCHSVRDCSKCKFMDFRHSSGYCPIGDDWIYCMLKED